MEETRVKETFSSSKLELGLELQKLINLQNSSSQKKYDDRQLGSWNNILRKHGFENNSFKRVNVVNPYKVDNILQAPDLDADIVKPTDILLQAILKVFPKLECLHIGDGIVSRRRLPKASTHILKSIIYYGFTIGLNPF